MAAEMNKNIDSVTKKALNRLQAYHWPGNVRELEKVVKRALILADDGETIDLVHFPPEVAGNGSDGNKPKGRPRNLKLKDRIAHLEKEEILSSLKRHGWNKSQVATELGISYPSLLSKIKRYNIKAC
jgi:Nif-specific regulatory protein